MASSFEKACLRHFDEVAREVGARVQSRYPTAAFRDTVALVHCNSAVSIAYDWREEKISCHLILPHADGVELRAEGPCWLLRLERLVAMRGGPYQALAELSDLARSEWSQAFRIIEGALRQYAPDLLEGSDQATANLRAQARSQVESVADLESRFVGSVQLAFRFLTLDYGLAEGSVEAIGRRGTPGFGSAATGDTRLIVVVYAGESRTVRIVLHCNWIPVFVRIDRAPGRLFRNPRASIFVADAELGQNLYLEHKRSDGLHVLLEAQDLDSWIRRYERILRSVGPWLLQSAGIPSEELVCRLTQQYPGIQNHIVPFL